MKPKLVRVELTEKQAVKLVWLIDGEMGRNMFVPHAMRAINQIGQRVARAIDYDWPLGSRKKLKVRK